MLYEVITRSMRMATRSRATTAIRTDRARSDVMFDPQTSGGLLLFMARDQAVQCVDIMEKNNIPARVIGRVKGPYPNGLLDIM